jgi:hypothetical protein
MSDVQFLGKSNFLSKQKLNDESEIRKLIIFYLLLHLIHLQNKV